MFYCTLYSRNHGNHNIVNDLFLWPNMMQTSVLYVCTIILATYHGPQSGLRQCSIIWHLSWGPKVGYVSVQSFGICHGPQSGLRQCSIIWHLSWGLKVGYLGVQSFDIWHEAPKWGFSVYNRLVTCHGTPKWVNPVSNHFVSHVTPKCDGPSQLLSH